MKLYNKILLLLLTNLLISCGGSRIPEQSAGHIGTTATTATVTTAPTDNYQENGKKVDKSSIPAALVNVPVLPEPKNVADEEVYTIVVHNVPINELLFALARDAKVNIDIDEKIEGNVTLNAIDQTLSQILHRLADNYNLHYEIKGDLINIRRDLPFIKIYPIDYLNISRNSSSQINVATEISSTGQGSISQGSSGSQANSNSNTVLNNISNNQFWATLEENISSILRTVNSETTKQQTATTVATTSNAAANNQNQNSSPSAVASTTGSGSNITASTGAGQSIDNNSQSDNNRDVTVNKEAAIITVHANHKTHRIIQNYLDYIMLSSKRQVMIEATIAEIQLSDNYQAGVDWNLVQTSVSGVTLDQNIVGDSLLKAPAFALSLTNNNLKNPLRVTLRALEKFGDVKVISSPKIMVLNNQTALLKVVDNIVYFTINVVIEPATDNSPRLVTYESEVHTVPIGFVMAVTAFVNNSDSITLNIRPTISRQIGSVIDPNPALAATDVENSIPVIQVREMESILKIHNNDTAVLGGLMQNEINESSSGLPLLSGIPMIGDFFSMKEKKYGKSELVIFIKPSVIKTASLEKDLTSWKKYLPSQANPDQKLPAVINPWKTHFETPEHTAKVLQTSEQSTQE